MARILTPQPIIDHKGLGDDCWDQVGTTTPDETDWFVVSGDPRDRTLNLQNSEGYRVWSVKESEVER